MSHRHFSKLDNILATADKLLKSLSVKPSHCIRANPAADIAEPELATADRKCAAGLMRVNHAGEVAAQGLYQGQALTAKLNNIREKMQHAADEEIDHLVWCQQRLQELDSHTSYLHPLWYLGSFTIGAVAGLAGDKWSLGFVAETENQVSEHLASHQRKLPNDDLKSKAIITQMREDEIQHAKMAVSAGAADLPRGIKWLMTITAKVMTATAYWV